MAACFAANWETTVAGTQARSVLTSAYEAVLSWANEGAMRHTKLPNTAAGVLFFGKHPDSECVYAIPPARDKCKCTLGPQGLEWLSTIEKIQVSPSNIESAATKAISCGKRCACLFFDSDSAEAGGDSDAVFEMPDSHQYPPQMSSPFDFEGYCREHWQRKPLLGQPFERESLGWNYFLAVPVCAKHSSSLSGIVLFFLNLDKGTTSGPLISQFYELSTKLGSKSNPFPFEHLSGFFSTRRHPPCGYADFVAESANMKLVLAALQQFKGGHILLIGPSGVGKSALANAHHNMSGRGSKCVCYGANFISSPDNPGGILYLKSERRNGEAAILRVTLAALVDQAKDGTLLLEDLPGPLAAGILTALKEVSERQNGPMIVATLYSLPSFPSAEETSAILSRMPSVAMLPLDRRPEDGTGIIAKFFRVNKPSVAWRESVGACLAAYPTLNCRHIELAISNCESAGVDANDVGALVKGLDSGFQSLGLSRIASASSSAVTSLHPPVPVSTPSSSAGVGDQGARNSSEGKICGGAPESDVVTNNPSPGRSSPASAQPPSPVAAHGKPKEETEQSLLIACRGLALALTTTLKEKTCLKENKEADAYQTLEVFRATKRLTERPTGRRKYVLVSETLRRSPERFKLLLPLDSVIVTGREEAAVSAVIDVLVKHEMTASFFKKVSAT